MSEKTRTNSSGKSTLNDDDITTTSTKGRRAFFRQMGIIGLGAATVVAGAKTAMARDNTGTNNNDGSNGDELPDKKKNYD